MCRQYSSTGLQFLYKQTVLENDNDNVIAVSKQTVLENDNDNVIAVKQVEPENDIGNVTAVPK